jgi:hypothetical protein
VLLALWGCEKKDPIPVDAHAALKFGWTQLSSADYEIAQEAFQRAADKSTPGSRDALMAKFGVANTYQNRKPTPSYDDATRIYQELATADKGGEIGAWSALAIVRMQHLKLYEVGRVDTTSQATLIFWQAAGIFLGAIALAIGTVWLFRNTTPWIKAPLFIVIVSAGWLASSHWNQVPTGAVTLPNLPNTAELEAVRDSYKHVSADFPNTDAADEAAMYVGASYIEEVEQASIDKGIAFLNDWLKSHANSPYAQHAYTLISNGYEIEARDDPAKWAPMLDALLSSVKRNTDPDANLSGAYYRIARVAEVKTKQFDIAKEYYLKLKKAYPTDSRIFYCNRALIAMGETVTDIPQDATDSDKGNAK